MIFHFRPSEAAAGRLTLDPGLPATRQSMMRLNVERTQGSTELSESAAIGSSGRPPLRILATVY